LRLRATIAAACCAALAPQTAGAWEAHCEIAPGVECPDGYAEAQTYWGPLALSEHRAILDYTLRIAGLPASFLESFELTVYTSGDALQAGSPPDVRNYTSVRPVRELPRLIRTRETSIASMANLPDFSYTLWDWASGNETCPPDRANPDAPDCHIYKTHVGWLNANHFLPMAERWYQHLHGIALQRAAQCRDAYDALEGQEPQRTRFHDWLLACEQEALAIEGAAQHYLQDAWSAGHMWERWGGARTTDFGGDRTLGFAISVFSGLIHGAKSIAEDLLADQLPGHPLIDDPMCAPHDAVTYVDPLSLAVHHGAGDVFADHVLDDLYPLGGGAYDLQRSAMLGCAVDGLRAVYEATAQLNGPLASPDASQFDPSRRVSDASCWGQRVTNAALATGCGLHVGTAPNEVPLVDSLIAQILPLALSQVAVFGLPTLAPAKAQAFRRDAAYACTLAQAAATMPGLPASWAASGHLPSLAGVRPNSAYLQGGPSALPASYADPFPPWNLDETDPAAREKKEALALTFLDAHAADRCGELSAADLQAYVDDATQATLDGQPTEVVDARCGLCARMVAPHLRFGVEGGYDGQREALCASQAPGAPFLYTGDDPSTFPGADSSLTSLLAAAYERCGCCAAVEYTLTHLDPSDSSEYSIAIAINDAGAVIGFGSGPFLWTPLPGQPTVGVWHDLPPLPGDTGASASDIGANGDVVGESLLFAGTTLVSEAAVIWENRVPRAIGPGLPRSTGRAVNDAGVVVGVSSGVGSWLLEGATVSFLSGDGYAGAINGSGALAGNARPSTLFAYGPAYWPSATAPPVFLAGSGINGNAADLSDAGVVVGYTRPNSTPRPFRYDGTVLAPLPGTTGLREDGEAKAVNGRGDIVGYLWTEDDRDLVGERAVLWTGGAAVDLNTRLRAGDRLTFVLAEAWDINERGQIVGYGVDLPMDPDTYHDRAFLLTPACAAE
jgi:uncharacterized membrane protein